MLNPGRYRAFYEEGAHFLRDHQRNSCESCLDDRDFRNMKREAGASYYFLVLKLLHPCFEPKSLKGDYPITKEACLSLVSDCIESKERTHYTDKGDFQKLCSKIVEYVFRRLITTYCARVGIAMLPHTGKSISYHKDSKECKCGKTAGWFSTSFACVGCKRRLCSDCAIDMVKECITDDLQNVPGPIYACKHCRDHAIDVKGVKFLCCGADLTKESVLPLNRPRSLKPSSTKFSEKTPQKSHFCHCCKVTTTKTGSTRKHHCRICWRVICQKTDCAGLNGEKIWHCKQCADDNQIDLVDGNKHTYY